MRLLLGPRGGTFGENMKVGRHFADGLLPTKHPHASDLRIGVHVHLILEHGDLPATPPGRLAHNASPIRSDRCGGSLHTYGSNLARRGGHAGRRIVYLASPGRSLSRVSYGHSSRSAARCHDRAIDRRWMGDREPLRGDDAAGAVRRNDCDTSNAAANMRPLQGRMNDGGWFSVGGVRLWRTYPRLLSVSLSG